MQFKRCISSDDEDCTFGVDDPYAWYIDNWKRLLSLYSRVILGKSPKDPADAFRDWQRELLELDSGTPPDIDKHTDLILQLPPSAGKTAVALWIVLESLFKDPSGRVMFCVPLRALAVELFAKVSTLLSAVSELFPHKWSAQLVEGPGAAINLLKKNVIIATYEHAAGELSQYNNPMSKTPYAEVTLVIIDELHNVAKSDRGIVVDNILYFSHLRKILCAHKRSPRPVRFLGLSGTLPDWVVTRLASAFPGLIRSCNSLPLTSSSSVSRFLLPPHVFDFRKTALLCGDICLSLKNSDHVRYSGQSELAGDSQRAIFFFSTIAQAEAAYCLAAETPGIEHLPAGFPEVNVDLLSKTTKELDDKTKAGLNSKTIEQRVKFLQQHGIYLHHAQLKSYRTTDEDTTWQDDLQKILAEGGFRAVYTTSTLSVGLNLLPLHCAVIGPNTLWTIDQVQQMIGRVGRGPSCCGCWCALVDGPLYKAPGVTSLRQPKSWFLSRFLAALPYYELGNGRWKFPGNFDIRGFFSPEACPSFPEPDIPGNGLFPLCASLGINLSSDTLPFAIRLSRGDPRSVLGTIFLLSSRPCISVALLWVLLVCRFPSWWLSLAKSSSFEFPGDFIPHDDRSVCAQLLERFDLATARFPGDPSVPSSRPNEALRFLCVISLIIGGFFHLAPDGFAIIDLCATWARFLTSLLETSDILLAGDGDTQGWFHMFHQLNIQLVNFLSFQTDNLVCLGPGQPKPTEKQMHKSLKALREIQKVLMPYNE